MLTHLLIFRAAMVRRRWDLPDAFRAMPRDFVRISRPGSRAPGLSEVTTVELPRSPAASLRAPADC
jgi:hypothetical protein